MKTERRPSCGWSRWGLAPRRHSMQTKTFRANAHDNFFLLQVASGFKITPEARDSGIMIFDKFHSLTVAEDANTYSDIRFISYSAAASIVLGSKLHDGKRCLTLVSSSFGYVLPSTTVHVLTAFLDSFIGRLSRLQARDTEILWVPYLDQDWIHGLSPDNTSSFRPRIHSSLAIENE